MRKHTVKIGAYFAQAPYGIAFVVDDATGFLIDPDWEGRGGPTKHNARDVALLTPAETAPDYSFVRAVLKHQGATITFTWGRVGEGAVAAMFDHNIPFGGKRYRLEAHRGKVTAEPVRQAMGRACNRRIKT